MTVTLGWKHAVVAAVLALVAVGGTILYVRQVQRQDILDAERQQRIEALESQIKEARDAAKDAMTQADAIAVARSAVESELEKVKSVLAATRRKRPIPVAEEVVFLRDQNALLEEALALAAAEVVAVRRAQAITSMALDQANESSALWHKRYDALNRSKKKQRRRQIGTNIGVAAGGILVGWGIGKAG